MTRRIRTSTLALLPALCAALATPAGAADALQPAFTWSGRQCVEPTAVAIVPAARVKPFLPAGFEPAEALGLPGMADVVLTMDSCKSLTVDEQPVAGGGLVADAAVGIASPDGSPGDHSYEMWNTTSIGALHDRLAALGVPGGLVPDMRWTATATGPLEHAAVTVPWTDAPYSFSLDAGAPFPATGPDTHYWRKVGDRVIRIDYTLSNVVDTAGQSQMTAAPGSELAGLIGGTSATGVSLMGRFDFTSTVSATAVPAPAAATKPERLVLRVSPRSVGAGAAHRFTLRVSHPSGKTATPVSGATVTLCGRHATTSAAGTATLRCAFHRPGVRRAVARATGYTKATARIVVRR